MSQQNSVAPNVVHALSGLGVKLAMAGLVLAVVCAAAAIFSGLGYRLGLWHFRTGFAILQGAFWIALAAALISLAGLILGRNAGPGVLYMGLLGVLIAGVTAYIPWSYKHTVSSVPFIHDITTDVSNPPVFVTAATLRKAITRLPMTAPRSVRSRRKPIRTLRRSLSRRPKIKCSMSRSRR